MPTPKTPSITYQLRTTDLPDRRFDTVELHHDGGTPREGIQTVDEAARWLIEHGEYAAHVPMPDGDDVLLVLPEPKEGLFSQLDPDPIALVAVIEYAGGHALVVRVTHGEDSDDDDAA